MGGGMGPPMGGNFNMMNNMNMGGGMNGAFGSAPP